MLRSATTPSVRYIHSLDFIIFKGEEYYRKKYFQRVKK